MKDFDEAMRQLEELTTTIAEKRRELLQLESAREHVRQLLRNLAQGLDVDIDYVKVFPFVEMAAPSEREAVDVVRDAGIFADKKWLAKRLRISEAAAAIRLGRAAQKGILQRVSRGVYAAPQARATSGKVAKVELGQEPTSEVPPVRLGEELPV